MKNATNENCLSTLRPDLLLQWDFEKNNYSPKEVVCFSNKKAWWICKNGHSWETRISSRSARNSGCPYCSNQKTSKEKSLIVTHPLIASEWDSQKNKSAPDSVTFGSGKPFWWKCKKCGYSWTASCNTRTNMKSGCPSCSGRVPTPSNNLATIHPDLLIEYDFKKNPLSPELLTPYSSKKVWWICKEGHSWISTISNRTKLRQGCPYCSNQMVNSDNSLLKTFPEVAKEWDYESNKDLTPANVAGGSNFKVWWRCKKNPLHSWEASIVNRTRMESGCPFCANQAIDKTNCIGTIYPWLVVEWDFRKNHPVTPNEVCGGKVKYWWKCPKGHEWQADIDHRARGRGCPICSHGKCKLIDGTICDSISEAYLYLKLKAENPDLKHNQRYGPELRNKRYDFYLPKSNTYIEVTSYNKGWKHWKKYLRRIVLKKRFVESKGCNFEFIQLFRNAEMVELVRQNSLV